MKSIQGDMIELIRKEQFDVFLHSCNCFNTMGAGLAKSIRVNFPEVYTADLITKMGDINKLGTINPVELCDYDAIHKCMEKIKVQYSGKRICFPKIGSGLGGGNWDVIKEIINNDLHGEDITLIVL